MIHMWDGPKWQNRTLIMKMDGVYWFDQYNVDIAQFFKI